MDFTFIYGKLRIIKLKVEYLQTIRIVHFYKNKRKNLNINHI